jgi:hypothetical protein
VLGQFKFHQEDRSNQQELNGCLEVAETFLLGFALAIRTGNFQTGRPKTAFVRLAVMHVGRGFFQAHILAFFVVEGKQFISPVALVAVEPAARAAWAVCRNRRRAAGTKKRRDKNCFCMNWFWIGKMPGADDLTALAA